MNFCISPRTPNMMKMMNTPRGSVASQRGSNPSSQICNLRFFTTSNSFPCSKVYYNSESRRGRSQSLVVAVAKTESSKVSKYSGLGTPYEPASSEGKLLSMILQKESHFFEFAVSEQLEELVSARDQAAELINQDLSSMQAVLQRRIAEVKLKECQTAVEDLMYLLIVHKFSEVEVPMVSNLSECVSNNVLEIWPSKCRELESIHSLEIQEMVREHVINILRTKGKFISMDMETTTKMDKIHIGRLYASSIMYGYFLKAAYFRHQSAAALHPVCQGVPSSVTSSYSGEFASVGSLGHLINAMCLESPRLEKLSSYVKTLDSGSLQRCTKLKSKEAINLIEKHTWALFGDKKIGDDNMHETFESLERFVLEAVAFGSFLWDVESTVDSVYGLTKN